MADRVFGPHVSGLNVLGIHIGATTEVFSDTSGGRLGKSVSTMPLTNAAGGSRSSRWRCTQPR